MNLPRTIAHGLLSRVLNGSLTVVEHGRETVFTHGRPGPEATVVVHSAEAWPLLFKGSSGLGESYARGLWDCADLTALFQVAARNTTELDAWRRRLTPLREPFQRLRSARVTPRQGKQDISAHYDLGNDLYALMLDRTMSYSSAYFPDADPSVSLEDASLAKLELICAKLDLGPSDHVVEIGAGWGGFAVHAATTRGCRVTTTTISQEQLHVARRRVEEAGVGHLVEVLDRDYRRLEGTYDKLVSVEMIEAVGWRDFGTFFAKCSDLLKPDGAMLLQAITMDDRAYPVEKASQSFIRSFIFPNGCLPSVAVIARCVAGRTDLRMTGMQDLTGHYPETLRRWRANVEGHADRLDELGYDERFRRIWRFYLAYCEAGFIERRIGVLQIELAKPLRKGDEVPRRSSAGELAAA